MIESGTVSTVKYNLHVKTYFKLIKLRLTFFLVVLSGAGFLLPGNVNYTGLVLFLFAGFFVTSAANITNQLLERKTDALMERTAKRPIVKSLYQLPQIYTMILLNLIFGLAILFVYFNVFAGLLAVLSYVLYSFIYTLLKTKTSFAVTIGAIPGALPPMIGYVAATGMFSYEAGYLFFLQFLWQYPHFWAIAWLLHDDYSQAGISLLPSKGGRDTRSAVFIVLYSVLLAAVGILPFQVGMVSILYLISAILVGLVIIFTSVLLFKQRSRKAALRLMFASLIYLPTVLLFLIIDKI